jgi:DNA (cytosine-5)-methyltransferase 1
MVGVLQKKQKPRPKTATANAVSLFSGGGGLDLGFEVAGFNTILATDIDHHSCETLRMAKENSSLRGEHILSRCEILKADARNDLNPQLLLTGLGMSKNELDLVIGGPPCQAFSVFGKRRGLEDPRAGLAFKYLELIGELRPKAFVFENVYGLLSIDQGRIFSELVDRFRKPKRGVKYEITVLRLDAVSYGVPQFRDRVFIIGNRDGMTLRGPDPICKDCRSSSAANIDDDYSPLLKWRTVKDALRGLGEIGKTSVANHVGRVHSQRIIDRYAELRPGERDHHTRINKLDFERPSFTIIVGSDRGGGKGHIHPVLPREVTPRESARIQTFPDWWEFSGTSRHPIRQIGNAVPPLLAAVLANEIRTQFFGFERLCFEELLRSLDQQYLFSGSK